MGLRLRCLQFILLILGPVWVGAHPPAVRLEGSCPCHLSEPLGAMDTLRTSPYPRVKLEMPQAGQASASVPKAIAAPRFHLRKGDFVRLLIDQGRGDLVVVVRGPGGETLLTVDALNGTSGPEDIPILAKEAGEYWVEASGAASDGSGPFPARVIARRKAHPLDEKRWEAKALTWRAQQSDNLDEKAKLYSAAVPLYEAVRDITGLADAHYLSGAALYASKSWTAAAESYRNAVELYRTLPDRKQLGIAIENRVAALRAANDLLGAWAACQQGLDLLTHPEDVRWQAKFLTLQGLVEVDQGDAAEGIGTLEKAQKTWQEVGETLERSVALSSQGWAYFRLGYPERARDIQWQALALLEGQRRPDRVARTLHLLGEAFLDLGDGGRASFCLQRALKIWNDLALGDERALVFSSLGRAASLEGNQRAALAALEQALALFEQEKDTGASALVVANQGWAYAELGQPVRALAAAADAERRAGGRAGIALRSSVHLLRARAYLLLGHLERAVEESRQGLEIVEARRSAIEQAPLRQGFAAPIQGYYEVAIESLMSRHRKDPQGGWNRTALEVSEKARARILLDSLEEKAAEPEVSTETLQAALLDADTALLELFVGPKRGYVWLVTRNEFHSFEIPGRDRLLPLVRQVSAELARSDQTEDLTTLHSRAQALSRMLLAPLGRLPRQKRLILVVPPEMQALPFAALPNPFRGAGERSTSPWPAPLLLDKTFLFEPSIAVLSALRRRKPEEPSEDRIGLFAAPQYSVPGLDHDGPPPQLWCEDGGLRLSLGEVRPLRLGPAEARSVVQAAGRRTVDRFLGSTASALNFLRLDLRPYRYLYLSVHGRADTSDANRSALVLSAFDSGGQPLQPCLFARDIAALRLSADLVMLSSCSSGSGKMIRGEGLLGLSQAFLTAGASRVGVALWDVQERPTSALMEAFHRRYLGEGMPPAEALRAAQIEMWRQRSTANPAHWGGFQLLGDWR